MTMSLLKKLRRCHVLLLEHLDLDNDYISEYMFQESIFEEADVKEIQRQESLRKKAELFLSKFSAKLKKEERVFQIFECALEHANQKWLIQEIHSSLKNEDEPIYLSLPAAVPRHNGRGVVYGKNITMYSSQSMNSPVGANYSDYCSRRQESDKNSYVNRDVLTSTFSDEPTYSEPTEGDIVNVRDNTNVCKHTLLLIGAEGTGKSTVKDHILKLSEDGQNNIIEKGYLERDAHQCAKTKGMDCTYFHFFIEEHNVWLENVKILDTVGGKDYEKVSEMYFKGATGALVLYDVTRPETLTSAEKWIRRLETKVNLDLCQLMVIGNKIDSCEGTQKIKPDKGCKLAGRYSKYDAKFHEASALTGDHMRFILQEVAKGMFAKHELNKADAKEKSRMSCSGKGKKGLYASMFSL